MRVELPLAQLTAFFGLPPVEVEARGGRTTYAKFTARRGADALDVEFNGSTLLVTFRRDSGGKMMVATEFDAVTVAEDDEGPAVWVCVPASGADDYLRGWRIAVEPMLSVVYHEGWESSGWPEPDG